MNLLQDNFKKIRINNIANEVYNLIKNNKFDKANNILDINKEKILNQEYLTFKIRILLNLKKYDEVYKILTNNQNKLMKRDFLDFIKIYYYINMKKCIDLFNNFVKDKYNITAKDVDFLIDNKLFHIIRLLKGYYIETNRPGQLSNDILNLNDFKDNKIILKVIEKMNYILANKNISKDLWNRGFDHDVILDCGNILNSFGTFKNNKRFISKNSYKYLFKIITNIKLYFKNPLLIIYEEHLEINENKSNGIIKYINRLNKMNLEYNNILIVPKKGIDDDIFILINSLIYKIPILTNDQFRNYIDEYKSKNNDLKNFVTDYTFRHCKNNNKLNKWKKNSKRITINDSNIYVPSTNNKIYNIIHHNLI
jgi:hypothetical protein